MIHALAIALLLAGCDDDASGPRDLGPPADRAVAPADLASVDLASAPDLADAIARCIGAGGTCGGELNGGWQDECDQLLDPTGAGGTFHCSDVTPASAQVCCHPRPCVQYGSMCVPAAVGCAGGTGEVDGGCRTDWRCCL
jgi:hypothetical protein